MVEVMTLAPEYVGRHRSRIFSKYLRLPKDYRYGAIPVEAIYLDDSSSWWIVPAYKRDDCRLDDMGPFSSADECAIYLGLTCEVDENV